MGYNLKPGEPNTELRLRSGEVDIDSKLVSFLYTLMRDHLPPGQVEAIVQDSTEPDCFYTNGWLVS